VVLVSVLPVLGVLAAVVEELMQVIFHPLAPPTEAVAAVVVMMARCRQPVGQASSSFATQVRSAVQAVLLHRQAGTPTTRSTHLGHIQHEPLCTNRHQ